MLKLTPPHRRKIKNFANKSQRQTKITTTNQKNQHNQKNNTKIITAFKYEFVIYQWNIQKSFKFIFRQSHFYLIFFLTKQLQQ
jgi:hypothetical protein